MCRIATPLVHAISIVLRWKSKLSDRRLLAKNKFKSGIVRGGAHSSSKLPRVASVHGHVSMAHLVLERIIDLVWMYGRLDVRHDVGRAFRCLEELKSADLETLEISCGF